MDYQSEVQKVIEFLKEKRVCSSSRASHEECYQTFAKYLISNGMTYSADTGKQWLDSIRDTYSRQRCYFWKQYMTQLEELFSEFVTEREKAYNSFTYLVLAMNRWFISLPKYAKEMTTIFKANGKHEKVDIAKRKFANNLKQLNPNPREFLFETVFDIYGLKEFSVNVVPIIRDTKDAYDNAVSTLINELIISVKMMFASGKSKGSLSSIIKDWFESLSERTRQYLYAGNENNILELMKNITNDENTFVQRLAKAVTYLRLDDWNNDTVDVFLRDLQAFKKTIEDFNSRKESDVTGSTSYEIIITNAKGEKIPKRFDKTEYSDRAKLLLNEMTAQLAEYGQSITEQEKRQVLIELLEKLC